MIHHLSPLDFGLIINPMIELIYMILFFFKIPLQYKSHNSLYLSLINGEEDAILNLDKIDLSLCTSGLFLTLSICEFLLGFLPFSPLSLYFIILSS